MVFDTHAAVKTLTDAGASEPLAIAVVDVARQAGTEAAGELVTRADFDAGMTRLEVALAKLESRLAWRRSAGSQRERGRSGGPAGGGSPAI